MIGKSWFERLFRSDRLPIIKVAGAGLVGLIIAARVVWQQRHRMGPFSTGLTLVIVPFLTMLITIALVRADSVGRELSAGHRVGTFSRILFGAGIWSLLIWIVGLLLVGFPLAIWLGSLTAHRPAG